MSPALHQVQETFPAQLVSVRAARAFVRDLVTSVSWAEARLSDIELATSEMSTNAVEYGDGHEFVVLVEVHEDRLDVIVRSAPSVHHPAVKQSGPGELSGRGLRIVSTIAESFSIDQSPERVIVSCSFSR